MVAYTLHANAFRRQPVDHFGSHMTPQPEGERPFYAGSIEPHASLLTRPSDDQRLYKIVTVENLLRSIEGHYLHFNRVDQYADFPGHDLHDGEQLPRDRPGNMQSKSVFSPDYSIADYYDCARSRTYACCFSLEPIADSSPMWKSYGGAINGSHGKVCLVFEFGKLRAQIDRLLSNGSNLLVGDNRCHQIFSINYGNIEYVEWAGHQANVSRLPNPIQYTYLKDKTFENEREHRISLSALGIGEFSSRRSGGILSFPPSLTLDFNFKQAASDLTLQRLLCAPDCDISFLHSELRKLGFNG